MVARPRDPPSVLTAIVPPGHLAELAQAGSVQPEKLRSGTISYKVFYRIDGRLRTIRIGIDPARAAAVAEELAWLQRNTRLRREAICQLRRTNNSIQRARRFLAHLRRSTTASSAPKNNRPISQE